MNCEQFRTALEADPAELGAECAAHEAACAECAAYAARLRALEGLIDRALRFDVAAMRRGTGAGARPSPPAPRAARSGWLALAAALVGGFAVWVGIRFEARTDPEELVAAALEHWPLEPQSWVVTSEPVSRPELEQVVAAQAQVDVATLGLVSYAHLCWVHGHWIPHLVVQGEAGPVMLLLMPGETIRHAQAFSMSDGELQGLLIPLGKGSVAVLGSGEEPLEPLRERVTAAVHWQT